MYLNAETQAFVIPRLHYALREDGFLFLGRAEMVLRGGADLFAPMSLRHRVFVALPHQYPDTPTARAVREGRPFEVNGPESPQDRADLVKPTAAEPAESLVAELLVDPDGLLTGANDLARQLFGITAGDIGRAPSAHLGVVLEPLDLDGHIARALAERMSHRVGLTRYEAPDGASLDLEVWVLPLFDEHEKVLGAAVTFADVSSTLQLRESFRHVHEELETAYEELQSTNEELVTSNEELQSSYEELETSNEELQSANEELETTNEELRSSYEELETTNLELKTASDAVGRLNETLVDANLELRRFSSLHHQVMDHLPSAVVVLNSHLLVEEWNQAATDLWGAEEPAVVGEPFFGLDFGLPLGALQEPVRACPAGRGAVDGGGRGHRPLGPPVHLPVQVMPVSGREPDRGHARHGSASGVRSRDPSAPRCGEPDLEGQVDALSLRLTALTDRIVGATGSLPGPLVDEVVQELAAAVEEFEVRAQEIHAQNEALAEAKRQLDLESARYRELFDLAPDGYLVTDTSG